MKTQTFYIRKEYKCSVTIIYKTWTVKKSGEFGKLYLRIQQQIIAKVS